MAMTFVDRKAAKPNRYLVTPENGGDPYYVVLERADEPIEVGTALNAETFNALREDAIAGVYEDITDYIVEQGEYNPRLYSSTGNDTGSVSNALWTYQKWASGRISIDGGIYIAAEKGRTNFGEGYVTAFAQAYGYPCEMTKEPHVTVGLGTCADNGFFWPVVRQWAGSLRKQTPVYAVCSGSAYGGDDTGGYHICVHVEGTWK